MISRQDNFTFNVLSIASQRREHSICLKYERHQSRIQLCNSSIIYTIHQPVFHLTNDTISFLIATRYPFQLTFLIAITSDTPHTWPSSQSGTTFVSILVLAPYLSSLKMFPRYAKSDKESLEAECRGHGLNASGTFGHLVARLVRYNVENHVLDTATYNNDNDPTGQKRKDQELARRDLQVYRQENLGRLEVQKVNNMRQAARGVLNQKELELAFKKAEKDQENKVKKLYDDCEEALKRIDENLEAAGQMDSISRDNDVTMGKQDIQADQRPAASKGDEVIQKARDGLASDPLQAPRNSDPEV